MLKLLKYELIGSHRQYLLLLAVYLLLCLGTMFLPDMIKGLFSGLLMVAVAGIFISIIVSIIMYYSRSMFGRPGYLTLTLPITAKELLFSKLLGSMIWVIIAFFILIVGTIILTAVISGATLSQLMELLNKIGYFISLYPTEVITIVVHAIFAIICFIASLYFTVTFVHTKYITKKRAFIGIGGYVLIIGIIAIVWNTPFISSFLNSMESQIFLFNIGMYTTLTIIFFMATTYLIDKKLQIE